MSRPATAREALVAELLGDVAHLLDRVEALASRMEGAQQGLAGAANRVASLLKPFEDHIFAVGTEAGKRAVEHVAHRTNEIARHSAEQQTRSMTDAAQAIFAKEIEAPLQKLGSTVERIVKQAERPWESWLTLAATAISSAAASAAVTIHLLGK